jgi:dTDP-4-dehydrorhamnose 3,5-epimerase-like enzyme
MGAKKDEPGPIHEPGLIQNIAIDGVIVATLPVVHYGEDQVLTEIFRPEWGGVFAIGESIDHLYTVLAPSGGIRKEWYYHEHTLDRYVMLNGKLELGLYDGRKGSNTHGNFVVISLGESDSGLPNAVRIPPLVWHSFKWNTNKGMFMNAKLPGYQRGMPDKFRVNPEDYPEAIIWNV